MTDKPEKEVKLRIETRGGSQTSIEFKTVKIKKGKKLWTGGTRRTFMIGKVTDDFQKGVNMKVRCNNYKKCPDDSCGVGKPHIKYKSCCHPFHCKIAHKIVKCESIYKKKQKANE